VTESVKLVLLIVTVVLDSVLLVLAIRELLRIGRDS
jgi:hypothetical protein